MRSRGGVITALLAVLSTLGCSPGSVSREPAAPSAATRVTTRTPVPSSSTSPTSQPTSTAPAPTTHAPTTHATSMPAPTKLTLTTPTPTKLTPTTPTPTRTAPTGGASSACATTGRHSGADLATLPTTEKVVALTFDAGANGDAVPSILATLKSKGAVGTFFLTGAFVRAYPDLARRIAAAYPVGNHTDTHPDLTKLSNSGVVDQIRRGAAEIESVTGVATAPLFRFPFGAVDARVIGLANQECYVPIRWTVDTLGWKGTSGGITAAGITAKVLANARPGEIVLMHVGSHPTDHTTLDAAALPSMIDGLRSRGYRFVTVPQLLG